MKGRIEFEKTKWLNAILNILNSVRLSADIGVYFGLKACEVFLCFVAIVKVRFQFGDFFVFFVLHH